MNSYEERIEQAAQNGIRRTGNCTCAKSSLGEVDPSCSIHGTPKDGECWMCLDSRKVYFIQGGPHGVGSNGRCPICATPPRLEVPE